MPRPNMDIIKAAEKLLLKEIEKTGIPNKTALYIALAKSLDLARRLKADKTIVQVGFFLMDLKTGQAWKEGKSDQHIQMSVKAAKKILGKSDLTKEAKKKIINCIEAHHCDVPYECLEAEICSHAESFVFLNPKSFLLIFSSYIQNNVDPDEILRIMERKIDEKFGKISLKVCKKEAEENYKLLKKLIKLAKKPL